MKTKNKPVPGSREHLEYIAAKEKILLKCAKEMIPLIDPKDDPLGDKEIFNENVAAYFAFDKKEKVKEDPNAKGKYSLLVKTDIFGGTAKHIHREKYLKFAKNPQTV